MGISTAMCTNFFLREKLDEKLDEIKAQMLVEQHKH